MPYFFDWQHLPLHARLVSAFRMGIPAGCLPSTLTRQCLAACRTLLVCLGLMLCSSYALAQPTVSSVSPSSGPTSGGTSATISGNNLSSATAVKFGGVTAAITANTATSITATVPAGTGTVDITVTTSGGTATLTNSYTYVAAPTVTNISPSSGPTGGGTSVTITGTNFNGTTAVKFGATSATGATINSNTQITATAPAGSGTVDITVTTTGGTSITSAADQYTYVAAPTLTSVSPNSGNTAGGTSVTLTGTNFTGATSVSFGGIAATGVTVVNATTITATTPAHSAGAVNVAVTTPSGTTAPNSSYTFIAPNPPVADAVSVTVAANSSNNPITLNLSGGVATSVAVASGPSQGTTNVSGTTITYTPAAGYSGNDSFTYTATGPGGSSSAATVSITVSAPTLAITPATPSLPAATLNTAYPPVALSASSGTAPYSYAVTAGSLPAGLSLNTTTGTISGTPTAIATYNFTITATDAHGATGSRAYSLDIQAQAVVVPPSNETVVAGQTASVDLTRGATGGPFTSATLLSVAPQQAGIVQIVAPSTLSFTPAVSYSGSAVVNFRLLATSGAQGNGFLTFTVTAAAPTASPIAVNTAANQPVTINAIANAAGAPFIGGPSISSQPASGSVVVQGMNLVYTPAASTQGSISFTYTLANAGGVSAPIAVMVQVAARPDPTVNADVRGLSTAQQQASVRFAGAQLLNFTQRLEQLRNPQQRQAFQNGLQLAMPRAGNNSIRNCQNVPSMLGQQDCIARQGMDSGSALAPRWGRTAQPDALAAVEGLNAEQAYASRLDSETANAPATLGSAQRNLAQRAVALGAGTTTRNTRVNADEPLPEPGSAERPRLAYWTAGMLDWGFADASKGQDDGLRFTTSGVTMGLDYLVNAQWTVGMGMGFAYDRTTIGSEGSRNHSKGVSTALYGSWSPAPAYFVDGVLGYSRLRFDSRRWVADAGEFAQGERDGSQWFASVSAGYEWRTQQMLLSPYGRLQWARSNLDAYTETGAGWHALQFGEQRITSTSASLGLRGETSHDTRWGQLMPFGRLELQHDFDHQSDVRIAYADLNGSQGYAISSNPIGRNRVQVGFGSRLQSRMGTFAAELQFTRSNTSFQRGMRLLYTTRY